MELTIEDVFSQGGLLAQSLDGYRERPSQIELANHVQDSLQEGAHFLAEAPTGTGKSMAYGVPAALHAIANDATVVIVTANITLQEQLIGKDLPLIAEMLGSQDLELGFELLKGMKNYVCRAALKDTVKRQRKGRENWLTPIIQWEAGTETGDKSELDEEYPSKIWSQVAVSSQDCVGKNCPDIGDCYAYKARRRAQKAHIVVANYHLLFADIMSGGNVLPEYCAVIMDEAHQAADIASDFQGLQITPWELKGLAGLLKHVDGVGQSLYRVHHLAVDQLFKHLQTVSKGERILEDPLQTDVGMAGSLRDLAAAYMLEAGNQEDGFLHELLKQKAEQARAYADELEKAAYGVEDDDGERTGVLPRDRVYYFDGEGDKLSLNTKVVDVRSFFRQHIFSKTPTVMMSATMATNDSFEFIGNQVGLNVGDYDALIVPSPFNTERVLAVNHFLCLRARIMLPGLVYPSSRLTKQVVEVLWASSHLIATSRQ